MLDVDQLLLDMAGSVDELVDDVALAGTPVRVVGHEPIDAEQILSILRAIGAVAGDGGVAAGEDATIIAQHAVDFCHRGIGLGLHLRGAARDQDAARGVLALELADGLARLAHRFGRHGAGVDHHGVAQLRLAGAQPDRLALIGIEAAAERDDVQRHNLSRSTRPR